MSVDRIRAEKQVNTEETKKKVSFQARAAKERLLHDNQILLNRFEVAGLIGGGGFAQIYQCTDTETKNTVAVKVEPTSMSVKRMKLEITVLLTLRGREGIPYVIGQGKLPNSHYLIFQLVGRNLSDIRRQLPNKVFSDRTLYRAMYQVLRALSLTHGAGFLHRDLKPSNCCIGTVDVTKIYLIDFGLTRQYLDKGDTVRKPRATVGMRGTVRYMSLDAHARRDLGPNNDLIAFLYTTIELGDGSLPWTQTRTADDILKLKQSFSGEKLCANRPKLAKFAEYIDGLSYESIPDYEKMLGMLEACNPPDLTEMEPYDWQKHPCNLDHVLHKQTTHENTGGDEGTNVGAKKSPTGSAPMKKPV